MTKVIKTKADHRRLRAIMAENTVTLSMTPSAGALAAGTVGNAYAGATIAVSNGVGNVGFKVSVGVLPAGLALNQTTGAISGTPTAAGTANFTITATDDFGNSLARAYSIAVT